MARSLTVQIVGDTAALEKSLKSANDATSKFGDSADKLSTHMDKMRSVAGTAGLALGGVLVTGLADSVRLAFQGQVSQAALNQALINTHQSVAAMTGPLTDASEKAAQFGFTSDDARAALARLETATGDTGKSITDLGLAEDIARFKHVALSSATTILTSTLGGSSRAAKQLGIDILPTTTHVDDLRAKYKALGEAIPPADLAQARMSDKQATAAAALQTVTDKVGGQAQAYSNTAAGGLATFHASIDNLMESLGTLLLPAIEDVTKAVSDFSEFLTKHKTIAAALTVTVGGLAIGLVALRVAETAAAVATAGATAAMWLFDAAMDANPLGLLVIGIVGVVGAFEALHVKLSTVQKFLSGVWQTVKTDITKPFTSIATLAGDAFGLVEKLTGAFNNIQNQIRNTVSGLVDDVAGFFEKLPARIIGAAESLGSSFVSGIGKGLSSLGATLVRLIKVPINAIIDAWNSIGASFNLPSINLPIIGKIGGGHVSFEVPQIPHLDIGGAIMQSGIAVVHRGEHVIPAGGSLMGSGTTVNVTVNGFVGNEQQLATQIVGMINNAALGSGGMIRERAIAYGR